MFRKNVAGQFIHVQGVDATTGGIKTGVTWTVRRCIDGTFAAATGTATEDGTTGWYKFALSQADTNGNNIGFNFTGTGAIPQTVNIVTTAADPTDSVRLGLTALANAAAGASGGLLISGSNSGTTTLGALTVTGSMTVSDGILVSRSSSNTSAITATGNGTGSGFVATSGTGATGDGIQATSAATAGNGLALLGNGTGSGLRAASVSGDAILTSVSTSGHGVTFAGTGTTKHGINATGGATTSHGINATGGGVGHGILATSGGGATGRGIQATANSTNDAGFGITGKGTGDGVTIVSGTGTTGNGITATALSTNGSGMTLVKTGSGSDLNATVTPLVLAKTTNITGFNDIAATAIVSGGAITTSGGAVSTVTTATNVTTVNGLAANVITATSINADAITAAKVAADVSTEIAAAVWDMDATGHQTQGTFGQAIGDPVADANTIFKAVVSDATGATVGVDVVDLKTQIGTAGAGLTAINLPDQTMNITGDITGNLSGSVGSVSGAVGSVTGAVGSVTGLTAADVGAIKAKTDSLTFTVAGEIDANVQSINDTTIAGNGTSPKFGV